MHTSTWVILSSLFRFLCFVLTFLMVAFWCYSFGLDEDLCTIDYKSFHSSETTIHPVLSLCFEQPFMNRKLQQIDRNLNALKYLKFLNGSIYEDKLRNIDYDNVTLQWSNYYKSKYNRVIWRNGSIARNGILSVFEKPYVSYNGFVNDGFVKCFAFKLKDRHKEHIRYIYIPFDSKIFTDDDRNNFYVYFHAPGEIFIAPNRKRYSWRNLQRHNHNEMTIDIKVVEILKRRNKRDTPCIDYSGGYDRNIMEHSIAKIGCRTPYQNPTKEWPICTNMETMSKHKELNIAYMDLNKYYTPPCEVMSSVEFIVEEWTWAKKSGKPFVITPSYPDQYRSIELIKAIDVQSLIGNTGGYIGLFLGKEKMFSSLLNISTKYIYVFIYICIYLS